jgi:hypothetical protein
VARELRISAFPASDRLEELAHDEHIAGAFLIRLLAFVLILVAIVDKNRGGPRKKEAPARDRDLSH